MYIVRQTGVQVFCEICDSFNSIDCVFRVEVDSSYGSITLHYYLDEPIMCPGCEQVVTNAYGSLGKILVASMDIKLDGEGDLVVQGEGG